MTILLQLVPKSSPIHSSTGGIGPDGAARRPLGSGCVRGSAPKAGRVAPVPLFSAIGALTMSSLPGGRGLAGVCRAGWDSFGRGGSIWPGGLAATESEGSLVAGKSSLEYGDRFGDGSEPLPPKNKRRSHARIPLLRSFPSVRPKLSSPRLR